jgi:hypothetical protein
MASALARRPGDARACDVRRMVSRKHSRFVSKRHRERLPEALPTCPSPRPAEGDLKRDPAPADHTTMNRGRSGWEQSLDPGASWQHSVRGLLPGTIFAVLFALAAVILYIFVSPVLGVIVGILAVLNVIVAVNHWIRLLSRARQEPSRYQSSGREDFEAFRERFMALPFPGEEEKETTGEAATFVEEQGGWLKRRLKQQIAEELPIREHGEPEYIILELPNTPSAPGIGVSRDPRFGPRPAPVFFVGFKGEEKLVEVMASLPEKTNGKALLMHQLGGDGETPFLMVPPMFHLVGMEEFAEAMRAYLGEYAEDDEEVAWLEEKCELLIYDKGQTFHALPVEDGSPSFAVISTLAEAAEASRRTKANASNGADESPWTISIPIGPAPNSSADLENSVVLGAVRAEDAKTLISFLEMSLDYQAVERAKGNEYSIADLVYPLFPDEGTRHYLNTWGEDGARHLISTLRA